MSERHWLIWDGECGLCSSTAKRIRQRDTQRKFQIVSYQNCPRPPMTDERFVRCRRELCLITSDGREMWGARAVFFALAETGSKIWKAWMLPPLIWMAAGGYWLVARNRGLLSKRFFGGQECGLDNRYPEVE